ncbi:hypothetical protein Bpfe_009256 [Biomphalaria pfeifferi]|uniref:Fibronectin type III domain-containing protein n=1 Tax=Biomphalaria pfeifferi TaxID=112525 RepID=A0AAD8BVP2_BIOPF|nr:hypothetical protein Bpfe_009256 [Biomphalaria pfeifferi]
MVSNTIIVLNTSCNSSTESGDALDNSTFSEEHKREPLRHLIQVDEILILLIIIVFWVIAVMAFLKKWDSIRIMQPMEPRYKHSPKNLDSIKIVKRAQDSIIYKNYSRKMSTTMVAREKRRLQRMHTVPCMSALPAMQLETHLEKLPTIQMEMTTEM